MNAYENLRVANGPATVSPQRDASLLVLQLATVSVGLFAGLLVAFAIAVMSSHSRDPANVWFRARVRQAYLGGSRTRR